MITTVIEMDEMVEMVEILKVLVSVQLRELGMYYTWSLKFGVISPVLCISTRLQLVTILSLHADPSPLIDFIS